MSKLTIQNGGVLTSNNGSYKLTAATITVNDGGSLQFLMEKLNVRARQILAGL